MRHTGLQNWIRLWKRIGNKGKQDIVVQQYVEVIGAYCEPHRHYHNLDHLEDCLEQFHQIKNLLNDPDLVEFALWMHDYVWNPNSCGGVNESESKDAAVRILYRWRSENRAFEKVSRLIMATTHSEWLETYVDYDLRYMVDIDLHGLSTDKFDEHCFAIEEEFKNFPEFNKNRVIFLKGLLDRRRIYHTTCFHRSGETKARENLAREIERISKNSS